MYSQRHEKICIILQYPFFQNIGTSERILILRKIQHPIFFILLQEIKILIFETETIQRFLIHW